MGRQIIHKEPLTLTTSSGSASGTTTRFLKGLMREVLVSPATSTNTYDISITSPQGLVIFEATVQEGDLADETAILVKGAHIVSIANATIDEVFIINLVIDQ